MTYVIVFLCPDNGKRVNSEYVNLQTKQRVCVG